MKLLIILIMCESNDIIINNNNIINININIILMISNM